MNARVSHDERPGAPGPAADGDGVDADTAPPRRFDIIAVVAVVVVVLDQATKTWALRALQDAPIDVIGSLRFNLAYNTGASFSIGSGKGIGPWVAVLALVVVIGLALGATSRIRAGAVASGLIIGGVLGNLLDRAFRGDDGFLHGAVVDFIDLQWWPVFNIADSGIVVGAIVLILVSLRAPAP